MRGLNAWHTKLQITVIFRKSIFFYILVEKKPANELY